jgi:phage tail sheath gpL-like
MPVLFNNIPSNLRVPLFYAEVNAGQSPFQGPSARF